MNNAGERAYVAAVCDNATAALDRARERAQAELDALLEEWSSNAAHQAAAAEAATRQRQEAHIEWLRSLTGDDASTDVRQIPRDASEPGVPAPQVEDLPGHPPIHGLPSWPRPSASGPSPWTCGPRNANAWSDPTVACSRRHHE